MTAVASVETMLTHTAARQMSNIAAPCQQGGMRRGWIAHNLATNKGRVCRRVQEDDDGNAFVGHRPQQTQALPRICWQRKLQKTLTPERFCNAVKAVREGKTHRTFANVLNSRLSKTTNWTHLETKCSMSLIIRCSQDPD